MFKRNTQPHVLQPFSSNENASCFQDNMQQTHKIYILFVRRLGTISEAPVILQGPAFISELPRWKHSI